MTDQNQLTVSSRSVLGKKVKQLREQGLTIASISRTDGTSLAIQVAEKAFTALLAEAGESTLIYLDLADEKKKLPVLLDEVQQHPLTGQVVHVTFREVNLKQKVTAEVAIELVGEVDVADGILVGVRDAVEVEALPADLPEKIEVDVTVLTEIGQTISLADLKFDRSKVELVLGEDQEPENMPVALIQEVKEEEPEPEETDGESTEGAEATDGDQAATSEAASEESSSEDAAAE